MANTMFMLIENKEINNTVGLYIFAFPFVTEKAKVCSCDYVQCILYNGFYFASRMFYYEFYIH